jgi:hypothetical protein
MRRQSPDSQLVIDVLVISVGFGNRRLWRLGGREFALDSGPMPLDLVIADHRGDVKADAPDAMVE